MQNSIVTTTCHFCENQDHRVLYSPKIRLNKVEQAFSVASNLQGTQTVLKCRNCDLVFAKPEELGSREDLFSCLENSEEQGYTSQDHWRHRTFDRGLALIERFQPKLGSILDIGTGSATFLKVAKAKGWQVLGIEVNKRLCDHARAAHGIEVLNGDFTSVDLEKRRFDVICFWDSLEHTFNPKEQIRKAIELLNPGGILLINYPAIDSIFARLFRSRWWFFIPVHFFYFSASYLRKFLSAEGVKVVFQGFHWQTLGIGHVVRQVKPRMPWILGPVDWLLERTGIGRLGFTYYAGQKLIVARKP